MTPGASISSPCGNALLYLIPGAHDPDALRTVPLSRVMAGEGRLPTNFCCVQLKKVVGGRPSPAMTRDVVCAVEESIFRTVGMGNPRCGDQPERSIGMQALQTGNLRSARISAAGPAMRWPRSFRHKTIGAPGSAGGPVGGPVAVRARTCRWNTGGRAGSASERTMLRWCRRCSGGSRQPRHQHGHCVAAGAAWPQRPALA